MTKAEREAFKNRVEPLLHSANQPKSRLIYLHNTLEEIGATRKAKQLGRIIGRLEAWQNSP